MKILSNDLEIAYYESPNFRANIDDLYYFAVYNSDSQCGGLIWDLFTNQYLFQNNKSSPILKDREKWNLH